MKERKQTDYHKLVGRISEEYYFCDYIFIDGDNFKGATGTIVRPVYKDEYEDEDALRDWAEELWRMAVEARETDLGLDEWIEYMDIDQEQRFDSDMKSEIYNKMRELYPDEDEVPTFDVIGGGRCFDAKDVFEETFDKTLLKEIKKVEAQL